jgi:hypothetical protein
LFIGCLDPNKGRQYKCGKWKKLDAKILSLDSLEEDFENIVSNDLQSKGKKSSDKGKARAKNQREILLEEDDLESKVAAILEDALQQRGSRDYRIDDRDIKEFPNFWTFCLAKQGLDMLPFPRQLWVITTLLAEACPACSSPDWKSISTVPVRVPDLHEYVAKNTVWFNFGICPKCGLHKGRAYKKHLLNVYTALAACIGQRAGKSMTLSLLSAYLTHKLLKLSKPSEAYGLLGNTLLTGTFVGLTFNKAVELLWSPFQSILSTSPWFTELHKVLTYYGDKNGEEYLKFGAHHVHYLHKNLLFHPSGPSKRTLRGATRVIAIVDEIGWFPNEEGDDDRERQSANEVYTALNNALMTVRIAALKRLKKGQDNIPIPIMGCISSPSTYRDKIMMLVKGNEDSEDMLTVHLPTWKFNPNMRKKDFRQEFKDNPVKAERDFGANPPTNESPFFGNEKTLEQIFGPRSNRVTYRYRLMQTSKSKQKMKFAQLVNVSQIAKQPPSLLSLDAGISNNAFSLTIGSVERVDGKEVYSIQVMMEIQPDYRRNTLNFSRIYKEVLVPLIQKFNVKAVVADRWQSAKILHDLEDEHGIFTQTYSLKYEDMVTVKDYMEDEFRYVWLPKMELTPKEVQNLDITTDYPRCFKYMPVAHLWFQLLTIQDTGNQVLKGPNLTDDLWRALALNLTYLQDEEFCTTYLVGEKDQTSTGPAAHVLSKSGVDPFGMMGLNGGGPPNVQTIPRLGTLVKRSQ